jgi:hypothetical protein
VAAAVGSSPVPVWRQEDVERAALEDPDFDLLLPAIDAAAVEAGIRSSRVPALPFPLHPPGSKERTDVMVEPGFEPAQVRRHGASVSE